jgi:AcrR family transcriptional regulator
MRTAPTREERRAQTRVDLLDAAERRFSTDGFHATSLDAVADEAGYTKGAVYSNFTSKEDLFFAVYERRIARSSAETERIFAEAPDTASGVLRVVAEATARRDRDDGWLAVFLEFWTHVLRHPEHRARFAALHRRATEPFVAAIERLAAERAVELPVDAEQFAVSMFAVTTALGLERLTQPDVVDRELSVRLQRFFMDAVGRRGADDGSEL